MENTCRALSINYVADLMIDSIIGNTNEFIPMFSSVRLELQGVADSTNMYSGCMCVLQC